MTDNSTCYRSTIVKIPLVLCCILFTHWTVMSNNCRCEEHLPGRLNGLITRIDVKGSRSFSEKELSRAIGISSGTRFSREHLDRSCSRLLRLCGDAGYPWAEVNVYVREDSVSGGREVLFALQEGRRAKVNDVEFTGNSVTRAAVLERQVGIRSGDLFSLTTMEAGRKKLVNWQLYDEVSEPRVLEDNHPYRVSLLFPVKESKPNRLSGMLGFGSGANGARRIWGNVGFLMKNILGTARRFEVKWSQASVDEKSLSVTYREPWIGGSPFSGDLSFSQRLRESVFTQIELGLGTSTVFSDLGRVGLGFSHERLYPHGSVDSLTITSLKNSLTAALSWSGGSHMSGFPELLAFSLNASYGVRMETSERSREIILQSHFDAVMWRRGSVQLRVSGGVRTASRSGSDYPVFLTIPFGGSRTVRGHRDGELYILKGLWTQNELRFMRAAGSDLHVFFDHAIAGFPVDEVTLRTSYISGYGAGIRAHMAAGLLELDLAIAPGKGIAEARIHAGLREEF